MGAESVKLIGHARNALAIAQVAKEGDHFGGTIDLRGAPSGMRVLFEEFEEIVNGQMFSFLDEIQEKIGALPIKAVFENGAEAIVTDLQIYPSTGDVSFKLAEVSASSLRSA